MLVAEGGDLYLLADPVALLHGCARQEAVTPGRVDRLGLVGLADLAVFLPRGAGVLVERRRAPVEPAPRSRGLHLEDHRRLFWERDAGVVRVPHVVDADRVVGTVVGIPAAPREERTLGYGVARRDDDGGE